MEFRRHTVNMLDFSVTEATLGRGCPSLAPSPVGSMGFQVERFYFTGQANQLWDIIRDTTSGALRIVSLHNQKCLENGGALVGGPLTQYTCNLGLTDNKNFYLEYQGPVPNCGGPLTQTVRTLATPVHSP
jgi:hypothetical protein